MRSDRNGLVADMTTQDLTAAERFFYEHAGYSYDPKTETAEDGRVRCARELAIAERKLIEGPYQIHVEPSEFPWDGDEPYDGPLWDMTLYRLGEYSTDDEIIGSLCCIAEEEDGPYLRVVAAELADEYIPEES